MPAVGVKMLSIGVGTPEPIADAVRRTLNAVVDAATTRRLGVPAPVPPTPRTQPARSLGQFAALTFS
jgi:hypothetical protein